jgi:protein gp37
MSENTSIEWTDATWNPIRGCSRVSEGCRNCYAERVASRFSGEGMPYEGLAKNGKWTGKTRVVLEHLDDPSRWRRPRRIFVNSMSDLFHESLDDGAIDEVFAIMLATPRHTFQVLTKRPERMLAYSKRLAEFREHQPESFGVFDFARGVTGEEPKWPAPNVWLGVSVENQAAADERIPLLLQTPAAVRFLSCEPLLGSVNAAPYLGQRCVCSALDGRHTDACRGLARRGVDWVIAGGESGNGARPMYLPWARSLRDQCAAASVPFFFKQWGEHDADLYRVGKRVAGSLLDGQSHKEFPGVQS